MAKVIILTLSVLLAGAVSALAINTDFSESEILFPDRTSYILPNWTKNNAYWWSQDMITEQEFSFTIEYLIDKGVIKEDKCVGECIGDH